MLKSKDDQEFYARDRSDRNSMLEMLARRSKSNLIRKYRKYLHFFGCENEQHTCFSYFLNQKSKNVFYSS